MERCRDSSGIKKERGDMKREKSYIGKGRDIHMVISQSMRLQTFGQAKGQNLRKGTQCLTFYTPTAYGSRSSLEL